MNDHQLINQDSGNTEWFTPPKIIEAARKALGGRIWLDPASCAKANDHIQAYEYFDKEDDGLSKLWEAETVWLNHPFGRGLNESWIDKLLYEYQFRFKESCNICFAATSEKWFRPLLAYPQCFLYGRTNYLGPDGIPVKGVTKGSVVTYLGPNTDRFVEAFSKLGCVKVAVYPYGHD